MACGTCGHILAEPQRPEPSLGWAQLSADPGYMHSLPQALSAHVNSGPSQGVQKCAHTRVGNSRRAFLTLHCHGKTEPKPEASAVAQRGPWRPRSRTLRWTCRRCPQLPGQPHPLDQGTGAPNGGRFAFRIVPTKRWSSGAGTYHLGSLGPRATGLSGKRQDGGW